MVTWGHFVTLAVMLAYSELQIMLEITQDLAALAKNVGSDHIFKWVLMKTQQKGLHLYNLSSEDKELINSFVLTLNATQSLDRSNEIVLICSTEQERRFKALTKKLLLFINWIFLHPNSVKKTLFVFYLHRNELTSSFKCLEVAFLNHYILFKVLRQTINDALQGRLLIKVYILSKKSGISLMCNWRKTWNFSPTSA